MTLGIRQVYALRGSYEILGIILRPEARLDHTWAPESEGAHHRLCAILVRVHTRVLQAPVLSYVIQELGGTRRGKVPVSHEQRLSPVLCGGEAQQPDAAGHGGVVGALVVAQQQLLRRDVSCPELQAPGKPAFIVC